MLGKLPSGREAAGMMKVTLQVTFNQLHSALMEALRNREMKCLLLRGKKHWQGHTRTIFWSLVLLIVLIQTRQHGQCVLYVAQNLQIEESLMPTKLKRHLETLHTELANKPLNFFQRKAQEIISSVYVLHKNVTLHDKAQLASYMVSYRIAREIRLACRNRHG